MDSSSSSICVAICSIEKEHMFSKAVTPSDVGKLNRLVIPKQYAEKYFPLNSSSNENGLLLNFEGSEGKLWRFRYSYWKSSQSYVITKGWSRFVKEKQLEAGDTVSFERGVGEFVKHRFFIDYRRRPNPRPDMMFPVGSLHHHQLQFQQSMWWNRLCYLASPIYSMPNLQPLNFNHYPHHDNQQSISYNSGCSMVNYGSGSVPSVRPMDLRHHMGGIQHGDAHSSMVIDSVPVGHEKSQAKRLRLFGVNMECPINDGMGWNNLNSKAISHDDDEEDGDDR